MKHLVLYFDAPLQSWGSDSRFDLRSTGLFPTRSGIIGMLCAAMGIDRSDNEGLKEVNQTKIDILVFSQGTEMRDYHTVGGSGDPRIDAVNSKGEQHKNAIVSDRRYLQNARFGIILSCVSELSERISSALKNPVWGIWLGRKNCIPSSPVFRGIYPTFSEAVDYFREWNKHDPVWEKNLILDGKAFQNGIMMISETQDVNGERTMDNPVSFSGRKFTSRYTQKTTICCGSTF